MTKKTLLLLLVALFTSANAWELFPPDDTKLKVVDRDYKAVYRQNKEQHYYAVLYNGADQSYLDVYVGLPWKRLHRWAVDFEGEKVKVRPRAALKISYDEEGDKLHIYWNDYAGYAEAAVHLVLIYDPKSGKFTTQWSD